MQEKNSMSYSDFNNILESTLPDLELGTVRGIYKDIARFTYNLVFNNSSSDSILQSIFTITDFSGSFENDDIDILAQHRILIDGSNYVPAMSTDKYMLFLTPEDYEEQINKALELYPNIEYNEVIVLSDDVDTIKMILKAVDEKCVAGKLPPMDILNSTGDIITPKDIENNICKITTLDLSRLLDITEYCDKINMIEELNNHDYFVNLNKVIEEIRDACMVNGKQVKVPILAKNTSQEYVIIFRKVIAELFLQYDFLIYYERNEMSNFLSLISQCYYDPSNNQVYDTIEYIRSMPIYTFSLENGYTEQIVTGKSINLYGNYTLLNTLLADEPSFFELDLEPNKDNIKLLDIKTLYNLNTIKGCKDLKVVISKLYKHLEEVEKFINITNIVFYEQDNLIYVGFVPRPSYKVYTKCKAFGGFSYEAVYDNDGISKLYPISTELDGYVAMKRIATKMNNSNIIKKTRCSLRPIKLLPFILSKNGFIQYYNMPDGFFGLDNKYEICISNLYDLTIHCKSSRVYRATDTNSIFISELVDLLGLDKVRDSLDAFGTLCPLLYDDVIYITPKH